MTDMAIFNFHNSPAPAGTAVRNNENTQTGAGGALERFFHKLELLLKNGHLPDQDDVTGERLPSELQDLKTFLEKSPGKTGDSFVLQRNDTERYCFDWKDNENLTVTIEKFQVSPGANRSGYSRTETWGMDTYTENVKADSVLTILNGQNEIATRELNALPTTKQQLELMLELIQAKDCGDFLLKALGTARMIEVIPYYHVNFPVSEDFFLQCTEGQNLFLKCLICKFGYELCEIFLVGRGKTKECAASGTKITVESEYLGRGPNQDYNISIKDKYQDHIILINKGSNDLKILGSIINTYVNMVYFGWGPSGTEEQAIELIKNKLREVSGQGEPADAASPSVATPPLPLREGEECVIV